MHHLTVVLLLFGIVTGSSLEQFILPEPVTTADNPQHLADGPPSDGVAVDFHAHTIFDKAHLDHGHDDHHSEPEHVEAEEAKIIVHAAILAESGERVVSADELSKKMIDSGEAGVVHLWG